MSVFKHIFGICALICGGSIVLCAQTSDQDDEAGMDLDSALEVHIQKLNKPMADSERLEILEFISYNHYNPDSTFKYAQMELQLARKLNAPQHEVNAMRYIAWAQYETGDNNACANTLFQTIAKTDSLQDTLSLAKCYVMLGDAVGSLGNNVQADAHYHKALQLYTQLGAIDKVSTVLRSIVHFNIQNKMFSAADSSITELFRIDTELQDSLSWAYDTYYACQLAQAQMEANYAGQTPDSIFNQIFFRLNSSLAQSRACQDLGLENQVLDALYREWLLFARQSVDEKKLNMALDSCESIFAQLEAVCARRGVTPGDISDRITWNILKKRYPQAKKMITQWEAETAGSENFKVEVWKAWVDYYRAINDYASAVVAQDSLFFWMNHIKDVEYAMAATQNMAQDKMDNKMREVRQAEKEREIIFQAEKERQQLISIALGIGLLLSGLIVVMVVRNSIQRRRTNLLLDQKNALLEKQQAEVVAQNAALAERNEQIEHQKNQIQEANNQITDSILYAQMIQEAAFPTDQSMQEIWGDAMILFHPLNIVSGDFYWTQQIGNLRLLAVADCTGHGVPGAFMSMLGISILNDTANILSPAEPKASDVLDYLRANLKKALKQNGQEGDNRDGMDMAFIILDRDNMVVHYAGAFRPLIIIRDGEAIVHDADRMPIGSHPMDQNGFTDNVIEVKTGDLLYMFSDGFPDQFGYTPKGDIKKFSAKRLRELLVETRELPFDAQREAIDQRILAWRSETGDPNNPTSGQIDDCILIGIRI